MDSRSSDMTNSHMRTEQKITITVCAIVTSFAITQVPPHPCKTTNFLIQAPSAILAVLAGAAIFAGPEWHRELVSFTFLSIFF
jgi:hypothetical protein